MILHKNEVWLMAEFAFKDRERHIYLEGTFILHRLKGRWYRLDVDGAQMYRVRYRRDSNVLDALLEKANE